jgi:hypothetical protein
VKVDETNCPSFTRENPPKGIQHKTWPGKLYKTRYGAFRAASAFWTFLQYHRHNLRFSSLKHFGEILERGPDREQQRATERNTLHALLGTSAAIDSH